MKTNILTLCDFAKDYNGQLTIAGTFNRITSSVFPTLPIKFFLVCQFELKDNIVGDHLVTISIKNKETGEFLIKTQEFKLNIVRNSDVKDMGAMYTNLLLDFDKVIFQSPGVYIVDVTSDGHHDDIEFQVVKAS